MNIINVELGAHSYKIFIGNDIRAELKNFLETNNFSKPTVIVKDCNVPDSEIHNLFLQAGFNVETILMPDDGELNKSLRMAETIYESAIKDGLDRKSLMVALGGGVVGDLTGFVAATFLRGVPFIQIPTTLLAQVDSSVGGKVAVNHALGKNLIGAFYQPKAVFIDLNYLKTLPPREIASGLGEIVKYGVISDADFFCYLETHVDQILALDNHTLEHIIARSCEIKADVVSKDEKEGGLRRILNFGHTIAHAIEEETAYQKYRHGEAVAIGMIGAAHIAHALNMIDRSGMISRAESVDVDKVFDATFRDKKTVNGKINWVLPTRLGHVEIKNDVPAEVVKGALEKIIRRGV